MIFLVRLDMTDGRSDLKYYARREHAYQRYYAGFRILSEGEGIERAALFAIEATDAREANELWKAGKAKAQLLELWPPSLSKEELDKIFHVVTG
jgi:hypothetical protein